MFAKDTKITRVAIYFEANIRGSMKSMLIAYLFLQVVVGPRTEILDIVPEWPGSEHDSRIFQNSRIYMRYTERQLNGMLIGDAGYPSLPFLLTPINNPVTDEEIRFV